MPHPPYREDYTRQARLYRQSRERWKQRCADKQEEIRYLRVRIRDLEASRERWKQAARNNQAPLQIQLPSPALPENDLGGASARRPS